MSETLGDILRKRQAEEAVEQEARLEAERQRELDKKRAVQREQVNLIENYFDTIKRDVEAALINGNKIPYTYLPEDYGHKIYSLIYPSAGKGCQWDETNIGYKTWKSFKAWANDNGMQVWWETEPYEHTPGYTTATFCGLYFKPL